MRLQPVRLAALSPDQSGDWISERVPNPYPVQRASAMRSSQPKFQQKKGGSSAKPKVGNDEMTILRVEPYNHFGKYILRPYVDHGVAVYIPKNIGSEKRLYSVPGALAVLDADHSELCRRFQKGLSMRGSCVEEAASFLETNLEEVIAAIGGLGTMLTSSSGKKLADACAYFN